MEAQRILKADHEYRELDEWLKQAHITRLFLVCGNSIERLDIAGYFHSLESRLGIHVTRFSDFAPNPAYESAVKGVRLFTSGSCDGIIAVGGGSAMDVAKCIKLFSGMDPNRNFLEQKAVPNAIPFLAVPTTAGTGSEATRFAVIYYHGEKQSITDESLIPAAVLFQEKFLEPLPVYQKKAAMLDALCHGVESFWSVNSTVESRELSKAAITKILENRDAYLSGQQQACKEMLAASYLAGKAINITQTTAGHAMCYKLTSLYGIAHGHAAALCVRSLWPYMLGHLENGVDSRGEEWLEEMFLDLAKTFGADTAGEGAAVFDRFVTSLGLEIPIAGSEEEYTILKHSVNAVRLKNNPISLSTEEIDGLYHDIIRKKE